MCVALPWPQAQQQQLEAADVALQRSSARLRELQQQVQQHGGPGMDGAQVVAVLQQDVERLRALVGVRSCACCFA